jgi:hypothetical protein
MILFIIFSFALHKPQRVFNQKNEEYYFENILIHEKYADGIFN